MPTPRKRPPPAARLVYPFAATAPADLLGEKATRLHDLFAHGFPVPPGFTLTADVCAQFHAAGGKLPPALARSLRHNLRRLIQRHNQQTPTTHPPLLAVRCSPPTPLAGLLPTVLHVGLTDATAEQLTAATGDAPFVHDLYRQYIPAYAQAVHGIDRACFDEHQLPANAEGAELIGHFQRLYEEHAGEPWPQDPLVQLEQTVAAALRSWNAPMALAQRRKRGLQHLPGTAVVVQASVFHALGPASGAGRAFTRDSATGEDALAGDYSPGCRGSALPADLPDAMPAVWRELRKLKARLERHYADAQEFSFVVERRRLYLLHTRPASRTPTAAVRIAVDLVRQKIIDRRAALLRVDAATLETLLHPTFDPAVPRRVIDQGLPASPGAASGKLAFTAADAENRAKAGEAVILVRRETHPEDVAGMKWAAGILTATGGMTSHAAVVARGWGKCCVGGAAGLDIDADAQTLTVAGHAYGPDDSLSLDGTTGDVIAGAIPTLTPRPAGPLATLLRWADAASTLGVRANVDTPADAQLARDFGAQGVGLCRTEHMFFAPDRIGAMRRTILAPDAERRAAALSDLLLYQRADFLGIFRAMRGLPVTIRLLDPPLHEFLPAGKAEQQALADTLGLTLGRVRERVERLREVNPMLGHRGVRLLVTYPEILAAQVRAILLAAADATDEGVRVRPQIMVPLVSTAKELAFCQSYIADVAASLYRERGVKIDYQLGTMIETPRAALTAADLAAAAEFFSFGTNDLTQMTFGYSRDDAHTFFADYQRLGLLDRDPFQSLDGEGVGKLIRMAAEAGRAARPGLSVGLCGEHGGELASIAFCHAAGLDYVSCSPYRVPTARLAAAQAAIRSSR